MFRFIKKLLFGDTTAWHDVEKNETIKLEPVKVWFIPKKEGLNTQLVYNKNDGDEVCLTYVEETNRLKLTIDGKSTPANVTTRVQTTINNRLKKAGAEEIPPGIFDEWEEDLMKAQGPGEGSYASKRIKRK